MKKVNLNKLKENLPKQPGILRKEEYFNSAVLIPIIKINEQYHLLFEKRAAEIRQGSEICFPGGEHDKNTDKSFRETALRETFEEIGIPSDRINVLGVMDTLVGPMGVTVDSFVGEVFIDNIENLKIDKSEVEKVFTVPLSFFVENPPEVYYLKLEIHSSYKDDKGGVIELFPVKQLNLPERYHSPWGGRNQKVFVYKAGGEVIWGITALLVFELVREIKKIL